LRIEEHTAEIANPRLIEIEKLFRGEGDDAVDLISGSTTFEPGVDLGFYSFDHGSLESGKVSRSVT
jgi:hypothetical protein